MAISSRSIDQMFHFTAGYLPEARREGFMHLATMLDAMESYVDVALGDVELFEEAQQRHRNRDDNPHPDRQADRRRNMHWMQTAGRDLAFTIKDFRDVQNALENRARELALEPLAFAAGRIRVATLAFNSAFPVANDTRNAFPHPSEKFRNSDQLDRARLFPKGPRIGVQIGGDTQTVTIWHKEKAHTVRVVPETPAQLESILATNLSAFEPMIARLLPVADQAWARRTLGFDEGALVARFGPK